LIESKLRQLHSEISDSPESIAKLKRERLDL
jgi:hypothetical protein